MSHAMSNRPWSHKSRATPTRRAKLFTVEVLEDRCLLDAGFRPIDETGNNVADPTLGTANTDLLRFSAVAYKDGIATPGMGGGAPTFVTGPRAVSNIVANQATVLFGSTDINTVNEKGLSDFGYTFGQFMDHDMDLTPDQTGQPAPNPNPNKDGDDGFPIPADASNPNDPIGSLAFSRSVFDPATGTSTSNPREQVNVNTSYLDLSQVYGSTQFVADALRSFSGGKLKTSPGNMLPLNNLTYFTQDQLNALSMANDAHLVDPTQLYAAGDRRANETIELTSLQTLFMRNHNLLATELHALHPSWDDERLYQEARKLNIAQYQNIVYTQYLPDLLGPNAISAYTGYDPNVDPSIATEFSTVAFRFGHSLLNNTVARDNNNGSSAGALSLAEQFFDPLLVSANGGTDPFGNTATDIGPILKGDADNNAQAMDVMAVSNIRNLLFGQGAPGEDLISRDVWRAHDNGIGTYNQVRAAYGLPQITDDATHGLDQITSDPHVQQLLAQAYFTPAFLGAGKTAGDIDPFIAGLAEDHVPGSDMGPLFTAILSDQFTRLRDGDQFFYKNESFTPSEQLLRLQGATLGLIISENTGITNLQGDVFRHLSNANGNTASYYTTQNGQTDLTGSQTGTTISPALFNQLSTALANPNMPGYLVIVDVNGNYEPVSWLQSYSNVQSFLQHPSSNIANNLSVQLLTTEFNVALGKVDATTSIYVPSIPTENSPEEAALSAHSVTDASGIANVQDFLNAAITELAAAPNPTSGSADATFESALRDGSQAINLNETVFILV